MHWQTIQEAKRKINGSDFGGRPVKHYILLSVEIPPHTETAGHTKWLTPAHRLERLAKTIEGIAQLGKGVWLLPRDQGMIFAAECINGGDKGMVSVHGMTNQVLDDVGCAPKVVFSAPTFVGSFTCGTGRMDFGAELEVLRGIGQRAGVNDSLASFRVWDSHDKKRSIFRKIRSERTHRWVKLHRLQTGKTERLRYEKIDPDPYAKRTAGRVAETPALRSHSVGPTSRTPQANARRPLEYSHLAIPGAYGAYARPSFAPSPSSDLHPASHLNPSPGQ